MCGPAAPIIAIAATAAQSITSGLSANQEGKAQAAIAEENAKNYRRQAIDAERRGAIAGYDAIKAGREVIASQLTSMAANNVDSSSGSMASLISDTAAQSAYDAAIARNNAEREAYGLYVQEADERSRAKMYRASGKSKLTASLLGGVVSGAGLYQKYYGDSSQGSK